MNSKSIKPLLKWLALALVVILFVPGHFYMAHGMSGAVVDSETKKPIEGAVVVAHWEIRSGGFADGNACMSQLSIQEAVTDSKGHFEFQGWGPSFSGCLSAADFRDGKAPELIAFKPGYDLEAVKNQTRHDGGESFVQDSEWNEKSLELRPFEGSKEEYASRLNVLDSFLYELASTAGKPSVEKRVPMMRAALQNAWRDTQLKRATQ